MIAMLLSEVHHIMERTEGIHELHFEKRLDLLIYVETDDLYEKNHQSHKMYHLYQHMQ